MSEKPLPKYIRRSLLALSLDDAQLGEKAYASWADAIVLDFARKSDRDWQKDLQERMPAAIRQAGRGGAEVLVRVASGSAAAELDATVFPGLAGVVMKDVNGAGDVAKASVRLDALEESRGIAR
jgi:citrate lyase beta subunit